MWAGNKLHIELPKGKELRTVMALLLLFLCAASFAFQGRWRSASDAELSKDADALVQAEQNSGKSGTNVENSGGNTKSPSAESASDMQAGQGYHVVLDAGHGATDSGKVGINGALEKDINLAIVGYLQELLQKQGVTVTLTRADDNPLYEETAGNKKMSDMKNRIATIENAKPDAVVSIHQNSYTDQAVRGPQVFYYTGSTTGEQLAACIQSRFTDLIGEENRRQVKANKDYYLLIHTAVPTVIVECGFLSNPEEAGRLITEEYQQGVAGVVAQGILDWLQENQ